MFYWIWVQLRCFLSLNQLSMKFFKKEFIDFFCLKIGKVSVLAAIFFAFGLNSSFAIDYQNPDTLRIQPKFQVTEIGFGGPAIKISLFNGQLAIMSGGRGSAVINNRFTVGGGGYGISNSVKIYENDNQYSRIYKMGYGGLELGILLCSNQRISFGTSMLFATGASFWMSNPKVKKESPFSNDFNFIYVLEPTVYAEYNINKWLKLHSGISYRYVGGSNLDYMQNSEIRNFSAYFAVLFGL